MGAGANDVVPLGTDRMGFEAKSRHLLIRDALARLICVRHQMGAHAQARLGGGITHFLRLAGRHPVAVGDWVGDPRSRRRLPDARAAWYSDLPP